ncbi:hypothetical protein D3C72_1716390 [compost metagenome]
MFRLYRDARAKVTARHVEQVLHHLVGALNTSRNLRNYFFSTATQVFSLPQQIGTQHYRAQWCAQVVAQHPQDCFSGCLHRSPISRN